VRAKGGRKQLPRSIYTLRRREGPEEDMRSHRLSSEASAEEQTCVSALVCFGNDDADVVCVCVCVCVWKKKLRAGARRNSHLIGANDQQSHESILCVFCKIREKQGHLSQL
jgi:hypothetical protein